MYRIDINSTGTCFSGATFTGTPTLVCNQKCVAVEVSSRKDYAAQLTATTLATPDLCKHTHVYIQNGSEQVYVWHLLAAGTFRSPGIRGTEAITIDKGTDSEHNEL
jgi:hypothetical protein